MTGVVIAVSAHGEDAIAAAIAAHPELTLVRRCADLAEALAAASAGVAGVVVVSVNWLALDTGTLPVFRTVLYCFQAPPTPATVALAKTVLPSLPFRATVTGAPLPSLLA